MKALAPQGQDQKYTLAGYVVLFVFLFALFVPSAALGSESQLWANWAVYILVLTGLASPFLFRKANTIKPTVANTVGFWISLIPVILLIILFLGVLFV